MNTRPSDVISASLATCHWVRRYREERLRTPIELYEDTGYSELYRDFSESQLERVLRDDPSLVEDWKSFSEDKRWSPAWYFTTEEGISVVGHYPPDPNMSKKTFRDPFQACAYFIKMEMEAFRARNQNQASRSNKEG